MYVFFVDFLGFGSVAAFCNIETDTTLLINVKTYLEKKNPDSALILLNLNSFDLEKEVNQKGYLSIAYDIALLYYSQGQFYKSLHLCNYLDSLLSIQTNNGDMFDRSVLLLSGLNNNKLKNNDKSEELLLGLLKGVNKDGYDSVQVLALKTLGVIEFSRHNLPKAIKYYNKALKIELSRNESSKKLVSALYQNIAMGWAQLHDRDSAMYFFEKALLIKEEYLPANDLSLALGYLNFSNFLVSISELPEALNYIDKAENIYVNLYGRDIPALAPIYQNKGSYLIMLRDYDQALSYLQMAYDLYQKSNQSNDRINSQLFINFGIVYQTMSQYSKAIDYLSRCKEESLSMEQRIKLHRLMGMCYGGLNIVDAARKNYLLAIDESELNLGINHYQTAASYFRYGSFLSEIKNDSGTLYYLEKALAVYQENFGIKNRDVSNVLTTIAKYYQNKENYIQALNFYQKAMISFLPDFSASDYHINPKEEQMAFDMNLAFILINKALTLYDYYLNETHEISDLKLGFETAKLATSRMEKVRSSFGQDNSKLLITSQAAFFYDRDIWGATKLFNLTNASTYLNQSFEFAEKSKAAVLQSTLREMDALEQAFIPAEVKEVEKKLKNDWLQSQNKLFEESLKTPVDSLYLAQLRNESYNKSNAYDSLITVLEEKYPRYYNLKYNSKYMSIEDVKGRLADDEAFIEYHLADTILYAFIIKKDTAIVYSERVNDNFGEKVLDFVNMLKTPEFSNVLENSYRMGEKGYELYKDLKLNVPEVINCPNLILIPDEILEYLSFDALVATLPDEGSCNYKKLDFLINHHVLAYGYSGNLFFSENKSNSGSKKVLAISPDYQKVNKTLNDTAKNDISEIYNKLYPLVNSEEEVNYALEIYGGKKIVGSEATERNFKTLAGNYSILHFAMHTIINDENPLASKLIFESSNDSLEDGFLNTYEIYNLELNADLAVLSACNTGSGKISGGEGIMSMARGFIYAGVPGIIMTLWAVEDYSSTSIIKGFYDNLKQGKKKDVALHDAKLNFLSNSDQINAHPYFWAAYVHIGNNSPIQSSIIPKNWLILIGSFISILIIGYLIYRKRRR